MAVTFTARVDNVAPTGNLGNDNEKHAVLIVDLGAGNVVEGVIHLRLRDAADAAQLAPGATKTVTIT